MTINDVLDSSLSNSQKLDIIRIMVSTPQFAEGGSTPNPDSKFTQEIRIGGKRYRVAIAESLEEKQTGLSKVKELPGDAGMLFVYDEPQEDLWFTMQDTAIDLDIIFLDEDMEVTSVHPCKAYSKKPIQDVEGNAQFVLEVNKNSGVSIGDELEGFESDEDYTDEDRKTASKSKMLVLDENGNVQMRLEGGERIFSRISTRKIIKQALKAYRDETDKDFIKLGKMVFKELDAQDNREPQYVNQ